MNAAAGDAPAIDVSVLVVNYNTAHLLPTMFGHLDAARGALALQTIVVDNASRDDSLQVLRERFAHAAQVLHSPRNVGFGRANNLALQHARGRYVLLLNTDAFVAPDTLERTVAYMDAHADCGVLGVRLVGRDGVLQPSCRYFPTPWNLFLMRTGLARFFPGTRLVDDMAWDHDSVRDCDWVPGCYYLVRREVIDRVGLFDPLFFLYYEEVDHCRRVRAAGWKVTYAGFTTVVHVGGESARSDGELTAAGRQLAALQTESELLYFRKHHGRRGVWSALALDALAGVLSGAAALLRGRGLARGRAQWQHLRAAWNVFRQTAGATRPTR